MEKLLSMGEISGENIYMTKKKSFVIKKFQYFFILVKYVISNWEPFFFFLNRALLRG